MIAYWTKYVIWLILSIAVAFFVVVLYNFIPDWLHMIYPPKFESFPTLGLLVLACGGRFADATSTIIALEKPGLQEGAPKLGESPSSETLLKLALIQSLLIITGAVAASVFLPWSVFYVQILLLMVCCVSFAAFFSNSLLSAIWQIQYIMPTENFDDYVTALVAMLFALLFVLLIVVNPILTLVGLALMAVFYYFSIKA